MSRIDVIVVRKNIGHSCDDLFLQKNTCIALDRMKAEYPYLDLGNSEYFGLASVEVFDIGTCVLFHDKIYYIVGIMDFFKDDGVLYYIGENIDTPQKDCQRIYSNRLKICPKYWYISDKGEVSFAFLGADKNADKWRSKSANYFISEAQAKEVRDVVLS